MNACERLFRTDAVYAFFDESARSVLVAADVWLNPYADHVHVCPNPIAMPVGPREFLILGSTKPGIHPALVTKHRVVTSFPSETAPASVIVYSAGVDAPSRHEVQVGTTPPAALQPGTQAAEKPPAKDPPPAGSTVTGRSTTYSFDEAIQDALAQAEKVRPVPVRTPDVPLVIEITKMTAQALGSAVPGLVITATIVK